MTTTAAPTAPRNPNGAPAPTRPPQAPPRDADDDLLDQVIAATKKLDRTTKRYLDALEDEALTDLGRAMVRAVAIERIRAAITPEDMKRVRSLMNSPLGFQTDRDPNKTKPKLDKDGREIPIKEYPDVVLKECFVESIMHGAHLDGDEWNIIKGKCFLTKNYFVRKLGQVEGVKNVDYIPGTPRLVEGVWKTRVILEWSYYGHRMTLRGEDPKMAGRVISVANDNGSTIDNVGGKVTRRAYKSAYLTLTKSEHEFPDGEVNDTTAEVLDIAKPPAPAAPLQPSAPEDAQQHPPEDGAPLDPLELERDGQATALVEELDEMAREEDWSTLPSLMERLTAALAFLGVERSTAVVTSLDAAMKQARTALDAERWKTLVAARQALGKAKESAEKAASKRR
jgi:hypothetical protein